MSLARNGGRKQGGLVCRPKKRDSLAHGVSKEHDDCLPRGNVSERGHTLFFTSLRAEVEHGQKPQADGLGPSSRGFSSWR